MMRDFNKKRYWIVGASEGLGREVAKAVSRAGAHVVLTARSADRLHELADEIAGPSTVVTCDVTDDDDVARAASEAGELDGLIWLVGAYWPQSATEWAPDQVTTMFDVNLTGAARVLGQIVPDMVARDAGHIVLTGSLSGFRGLPNSIGYGASKAGLMVLAESMYADLRQTGVDVQLVNPGFVRTRLTDKNDFHMPMMMEPEDAAREIMEHMHDDTFAKNFPRSFGALFRVANFVPDWMYYRLLG